MEREPWFDAPAEATIVDLLIAVAEPDAAVDSPERKVAWDEIKRRSHAASVLKGAVRSTQDTLLHKVPRTEAVKLQLEVNRAALESANSQPGPE